MCECVEDFTCVKCLGEMEAEWRYEHEADMNLNREGESNAYPVP